MPTRLRKVRKLRGSRTHGYGQVGQHRHSGKRGGHGQAGLHKHKWSWLIQNEPDHFRRDPFVPPGYPKPSRWINVGELETLAKSGGKEEEKKKEKEEGEPVSVDLSSMGYEKLLGAGKVSRAFNVKVGSFTKRAQAKIAESGGKILS